jgi:hypothetical protein
MAEIKISHTQDVVLGGAVVASLTERALNHQFEVLFKQGLIKPRLNATTSKMTIDAELLAPSITLGIDGSNNPAGAILKINLKSGTMKYWDPPGPDGQLKEVPIQDWTYGFRVNLDMKQFGHAEIQGHPAIPPEIKNVLLGAPEDQFKIDHLFADIENAKVAMFDPNLTNLPGLDETQVDAVSYILNGHFLALKGSPNPYILGYAVRAKSGAGSGSGATGRDVNFHVHRNSVDGGKSTLSILVSLPDKTLPQDLNSGAAVAEVEGDFQGRYVLARTTFFENRIVQTLVDALKEKKPQGDLWGMGYPQPTESGWKMEVAYLHQAMVDTQNGIVLRKIDTRTATLAFVQPDAVLAGSGPSPFCRLQGSGEQRVFNYYFRGGENDQPSQTNQEFFLVRWLPYTASLTFTVGDRGEIALGSDFSQGQMQKDFRQYGFRHFDGGRLDLMYEDFKKKAAAEFSAVKQAFTSFPAFVLPGADAFYFKNPRLDGEGNVCLYLTVKSPH